MNAIGNEVFADGVGAIVGDFGTKFVVFVFTMIGFVVY